MNYTSEHPGDEYKRKARSRCRFCRKGFCRKAVAATSVGIVACLSAGAISAGTINYTFKTDIREVNTGMVDGQEYLTIEINKTVGPMACRGNVLRLNADSAYNEKIEAVAFSALLQQDQVMITVPLQQSDCVDGKPAILDMYLLHNSSSVCLLRGGQDHSTQVVQLFSDLSTRR